LTGSKKREPIEKFDKFNQLKFDIKDFDFKHISRLPRLKAASKQEEI